MDNVTAAIIAKAKKTHKLTSAEIVRLLEAPEAEEELEIGRASCRERV